MNSATIRPAKQPVFIFCLFKGAPGAGILLIVHDNGNQQGMRINEFCNPRGGNPIISGMRVTKLTLGFPYRHRA